MHRARASRAAVIQAVGLVAYGPVASQGPRQPPNPDSRWSASAGPQEPLAYGIAFGGASSSGWMTRQHSSTLSWRVKWRAVADQRGVQQHLVGGGPLAALLGELHVELDLARLRLRSARWASRIIRIPVEGSILNTIWDGSGRRRPRGMNGSRGAWRNTSRSSVWLVGQALAGADEERHSRPAPVVDLQAAARRRSRSRSRARPRRSRRSRRTARARTCGGSASSIAREHGVLGVLLASGVAGRREAPSRPPPPPASGG